jgi:hypothetical protein
MQEFLTGKIILCYNRHMNEILKPTAHIIGFREWVALPVLGLEAIKAKVDTGAKTSSLHAFDIHLEPVGKKTYVVFKVHPLQKDLSVVVECRALLIDQRIVTDSGGHREHRYVIRTLLQIGGVKKKVEFTLSNRESMKYRMLIGRSALKEFYIDPSQSYLCGKTLKQRRFLKEVRESKARAEA